MMNRRLPGFFWQSEANFEKNGFLRLKTPGSPRIDSYISVMGGYVYILCNLHNTTLYVGVTSRLAARICQHKEKFYPKGFSVRYNCVKLVYYQFFDTIIAAIAEEKRLKGGSRKEKEKLINSINPGWMDLYEEAKFL